MSLHHKAYKETLTKGYASEWNDDHEPNYNTRICQEMLRLGYAIIVEWDTSETLFGNVPVWTLVNGHSFVVCNTGATTGRSSSMKAMLGGAASNVTTYDDLPILTTAVELVAFHNVDNVVEFGFMDNAVPPFTANQDGAYFRVFNDNLYAVTGDGAAETTTLIGAWSQYSHYRIKFDTSTVYFYVDNMVNPAAAHTANLPDSDLTIKYAVISANNVDSTIRVDACGLERLRKQ